MLERRESEQRENSRDLQRGPSLCLLKTGQCICMKKGSEAGERTSQEGLEVKIPGTHKGPGKCPLLPVNRYTDVVIINEILANQIQHSQFKKIAGRGR